MSVRCAQMMLIVQQTFLLYLFVLLELGVSSVPTPHPALIPYYPSVIADTLVNSVPQAVVAANSQLQKFALVVHLDV